MNISSLVCMGAVCLLYFVTGRLSLSLEAVHSVAAAVWPPAGIALVALLLYGYSLWPGIACAAFLVHLSVGMPLLAAGGVALGHTLEAVLGAVLLARGERIAHYETQRVRKDGTRLEAALQQAYVTLEQRVQERTAALVAANETLSREIAERQRLEREAQQAEHLALLGRLAAGVSHELRNPLGAIFLYVDLLEEELRSPSPESHEEAVQALAEIKTNLGRVDDIVQDYLSLARVTQMGRTPQDLGAAVRAWVEEWQGTAAARGVTLQLDGLADLGTVPCHASSLRRVVLNLIQNALDAMPQGGTLTVTGAGTATHVHLQVRDTGSGILPEQLPRLFEPLYTTKAKGTGLGLYIVQQIVAAHGGEVTVHSRVRQGTTFTLTLPRAREQSPAWPRLVAPCHADAALATRTGCDPRPPERHT